MVPYAGGVFLPVEQRYTSPIYRRLHRIDRAEWLSLAEAAELVAAVRLLGISLAKRLFHWDQKRMRQVRRLLKHEPVVRASEAYHEANMRALSEEDGHAALRAIVETGWKAGRPPQFVVSAIQARRGRGESLQKIADDLGMQRDRLQSWVKPPERRLSAADKASFSLLMG